VSLTITGGQAYSFTATVVMNGAAAPGVTTAFRMVSPSGAITTYSAVTNSTGVAAIKGKLTSRERGVYLVRADATASGVTATALGSFKR
jgi:hypothetical protein